MSLGSDYLADYAWEIEQAQRRYYESAVENDKYDNTKGKVIMYNNDPKRVATNEVRLSYAHLNEPYANPMQPGAKARFSVTLLIPKTDTETKKQIDDMIVEIEDDCILLIAKQQPIAHDLRVIATGFKISTDIERIGDHAFDIARTAKTDGELLDDEHAALVKELGDCATLMVAKAMEAYRDANVRLADDVRHMDKRMDDIFQRTFYSLSHFVTESGTHPEEATKLLFIARFLERIGDHAVNIAEWVVYLETAERIRTKKARYEKM